MKKTALPILAFALSIQWQHAAADNSIYLGTGIGVLHGNSLGINLGYRPIDYIEVFATYGAARKRPSIGMHFHLRKGHSHFFQPRASIVYGMNSSLFAYEENANPERPGKSHRENFNGVSIGAGTRLVFGRSRRNALNLDAFYRLTDGGYEKRRSTLEAQGRLRTPSGQMAGVIDVVELFTAESESDFQLSVGYSFRF